MYYHVTPKHNLDSILQHGIVPSIGERSLEKGENVANIYLFPTKEHCEDALLGWLGECFEEQDDDFLVILAIEPSSIMVVDYDNFEITSSGVIPASSINKIYDESFSLIK
jgi:hypothetical protein